MMRENPEGFAGAITLFGPIGGHVVRDVRPGPVLLVAGGDRVVPHPRRRQVAGRAPSMHPEVQ